MNIECFYEVLIQLERRILFNIAQMFSQVIYESLGCHDCNAENVGQVVSSRNAKYLWDMRT